MPSVRSFAPFLLLAVSVAACSDAAGPRPASDFSSSPLLSASVSRGTAVYNAGGPVFLDCLGETVDHWFSVPYAWNSVTTPRGGTVFTDHFLGSQATGQMWGLTSGTVWTAGHVVSPEAIIATAGAKYFFTANIFWVSTTGPTIHLHGNYHFVQNANGDIVVDKANSADCTLHHVP